MAGETIHIDDDGNTRVKFTDCTFGAELRLPSDYYKAIEFLAHSWWRRTLIKLISGGRIEFRG